MGGDRDKCDDVDDELYNIAVWPLKLEEIITKRIDVFAEYTQPFSILDIHG